MKSEIVWTRGAEGDLLHLYNQIGDHDVALKILRDPLDHSLELLSQFPALGAHVHGTTRVRRLLTGYKRRFALFYVQEGNRVFVHAFLDTRQDPDAIARRLRGL